MVALARRLKVAKNPLVFPNVVPGFDLSHLAATSATLCAVARGGTFIDMLTGKAGAVTGTPNNIIHNVLGPAVKLNGAENIAMSGKKTYGTNLAPLNDTMAFIGIFNTVAASQCLFALGTNGTDAGFSWSGTSAANGIIGTGHAGLALMNGPNQNVGVPFFTAVSQNLSAATSATQVWNSISVNLLTGQTVVVAGTQGGYNVGSRNGVYNIGSRGGASLPATSSLAAVMASDSFMSVAALKQWALNPWSFWYPSK